MSVSNTGLFSALFFFDEAGNEYQARDVVSIFCWLNTMK